MVIVCVEFFRKEILDEEEKKEEEGGKTGTRQRGAAGGVEEILIDCASLTSAYVYQCGLVVRAHPSSCAAKTLRFPTSIAKWKRAMECDFRPADFAICHRDLCPPTTFFVIFLGF